MLKLKTRRSALKRFKCVGFKKKMYKHKQSHMRHFLVKKSSKRKRQLRNLKVVSKSDVCSVKLLLPYS